MTQNILDNHTATLRKICSGVLLTLWGSILFAQSLTPSVHPASGGYNKIGNLQLQYTIGEPLIVTYKITGQDELSQGFEQPELNIIIDDCMSAGPGYSLPFNTQSQFDTIYISTKLLFFSPGYDYTASDSIYFSYHVISPSTGSEVVGITPVKFTCNGYYLADNLSALTSGTCYRIEFLLYSGNRYSFNLKKN